MSQHFVIILFTFMLILVCGEAWIQRGKNDFGVESDNFDEEDLRFNDYENRLEDSFFKYVARSDDYDRNEVPWENGDKPVQVKMSAYLRKVELHQSQQQCSCVNKQLINLCGRNFLPYMCGVRFVNIIKKIQIHHKIILS